MIEIPLVPRSSRFMWLSGMVGAAGLALTLLSALWMPQRAIASYLVAYCFYAGIGVAALLLVMTFHATSARWMLVLRRLIEGTASTIPLLAVLFLPIALGLSLLYPWAGADRYLGHGDSSLLAEKARWLSPTSFLLRSAGYFVVWIVTSELLLACSKRQDGDADVGLLRLQRRVGAAALPAVGLTMTFAAFDWLMSLQPDWGSTIFGVYWFSGSFLGAHAVAIVAATLTQDAGLLRGRMNPAHYHSLGKLLFAFVCFWAYIAFSQFLLVWIANRPNEISWYSPRLRGPYLTIALILVFGKFAAPFFVLLSKRVKTHRHALSVVAVFLLAMQYLDVYWLLMPSLARTGSLPRWTDLTALVGMGGLCTAFALWRLGGSRVIPACDPYLNESLRYSKP